MNNSAINIEEKECRNGQRIGYACLNAPQSLNALTLSMIKALTKALQQWRSDPRISCVWLEGAEDRAFCAGGDIVKLYESMCEHPQDDNPYAEQFFGLEYRLDYLIHTYPKPIICWGNGVVMGGGLGLMAGSSHRIVTETSRIAMPEVNIGLFPDVGGTWFLSRMSDGNGLYLGLTGAACNASDALELGWGDHFLPHSQKNALLDSLLRLQWSSWESNHSRVTQLLRALQEQHKAQQPQGQVARHRALIRQVTQGETLAEVIDSILALPAQDDWMRQSQQSLQVASPTSLHLVWRQIKEGAKLSLPEVFKRELIMAIQCTRHPEFREGVRALLIDKDKQPRWQYTGVQDVPTAYIDGFFTPPWDKHPLEDLAQR